MREAPTACAVRNISVRVCRCDATRARDPRCGALATRPAAGGARVALGRARGITFNTVYAERFLFLSPSAAGRRGALVSDLPVSFHAFCPPATTLTSSRA